MAAWLTNGKLGMTFHRLPREHHKHLKSANLPGEDPSGTEAADTGGANLSQRGKLLRVPPTRAAEIHED